MGVDGSGLWMLFGGAAWARRDDVVSGRGGSLGTARFSLPRIRHTVIGEWQSGRCEGRGGGGDIWANASVEAKSY